MTGRVSRQFSESTFSLVFGSEMGAGSVGMASTNQVVCVKVDETSSELDLEVDMQQDLIVLRA